MLLEMEKKLAGLAQTVTDQFGVAGLAIGILWGEEFFAKGFGVRDIRTR